MTSYRQPDADFALAAEGDDELLPTPGESDPLWMQRARRPAIALLALAVASVVAAQALSGGASRPTARPTSSAPPRPAELQYVEASQVARPVSGLVSDDLSEGCPADAACRTSSEIPAGVAAALRARFGAYQAASARTVTTGAGAGTRLVVRFVHAVTDSADVTIQVFDHRLRDVVSVSGTGGAAIVVAQRAVNASTVRVTVGGPGASARKGSPTLLLLADPRLLQLT